MPDAPKTGSPQVIALAMLVSAIALFVLAYLMYAGVVPLPEETRPIAGMFVGAAALADLAIGIWFFSKGQSS